VLDVQAVQADPQAASQAETAAEVLMRNGCSCKYAAEAVAHKPNALQCITHTARGT
jgi:hypothetical protein